jgi:C6 transcription factor Pro1
MDGGPKQQDMAERLKREVKQKAHLSFATTVTEAIMTEPTLPPLRFPRDVIIPPIHDSSRMRPVIRNDQIGRSKELVNGSSRTEAVSSASLEEAFASRPFGRSDPSFVMFFIDHVLPFLFPFYRPSYLLGGKAWVLELMTTSPVLRLATLCQSSYFFSIARGSDDRGPVWDAVLTQSEEAFEMLRKSLLDMGNTDITENLHGAVTVMASIIQVERFEITISSFGNWQAHLNAALALFRQILDCPIAVEQMMPNAKFKEVMSQLGPPAWISPTRCLHVPSAEQVAFGFSSALLILDDIVSSTVRRERPKLYDYHHCLLSGVGDAEPPIDLPAVVGCQNWVMLSIGEIAALDEWKQVCNNAGNLSVIELVSRAQGLKGLITERLKQQEEHRGGPVAISKRGYGLLPLLSPDYFHQSDHLAGQSALVTAVWAHAALLYLYVVVSGWQPANSEVRHHVGQILELLETQISPPTLLRTMVWPFCVAGCLAEPSQEAQFRNMVAALQPAGVFGTTRKALEIMEDVWLSRDIGSTGNRDFASCFTSRGDFVLLV